MPTLAEPALSVAVDVGPLAAAGSATGVARAVAGLVDALATLPASERPDVVPYVVSFRARDIGDAVRLRLPASAAQRCWGRFDHPRVGRRLRPARVIHGTNYVVPPSRLARIVSVYDTWFLRHPNQAREPVARAGRVLRRSIASGAWVHAPSQATADWLGELFPGARVDVVPLGGPGADEADAARAPITELVDRPFVLSVATLEKRKNLPTLVRAYGALATLHPDIALVLAGQDGDDTDSIDRAVAALPAPLRSNVVRTGRVGEPERRWLIDNAAAVAYPSWDEGFGFPLLDAMAAGVPLVAADTGSIPEVTAGAAELVPAADADALAQALDRVLHDSVHRARLIAAGRDRVGEFDWHRSASRMAALYSAAAMEVDG